MSKTRKIPSLRLTVFIVVGLCLALFIAAFYATFRMAVSRMLAQSEEIQVREQQAVISGRFADDCSTARLQAQDIAFWDETLHFAQGENPDYLADNWPSASPVLTYQTTFLLLKDADGRDILSEFRDPATKEELSLPIGLSLALNPFVQTGVAQYRRNIPREELGISGVLLVNGAYYYVNAMPICVPGQSQKAAGTLYMGKLLNTAYFRNITQYQALDFTFRAPWRPGQTEAPAYVPANGSKIVLTLPMQDINGNSLLLQASGGRAHYIDTQQIIVRATLALLAVMVLLVCAVYIIMSRMLMRPIEQLGHDLISAADTGHIDATKYAGSREFAVLSGSANAMLENLQKTNISLRAFTNILNGMDAFIMVTNPDTDEILFINRQMREHYQLSDDVIGKVCWRVLQKDGPGRCPQCPLSQLEQQPETPIAWEEESPDSGRVYRNTDHMIEWAGGRLAHLRHSVDITDVKRTEEALKQRLQQQELMSAMSQSFLSADGLSKQIDDALAMTGAFMNPCKILLARVDRETGRRWFQHEWRNPKKPKGEYIPYQPAAFEEGEPTFDAFIRKRLDYVTYHVSQQSPWYDYLPDIDVATFLAVPIYLAGEVWGILCFDSCKPDHVWSESDIQLSRLVGSLISGVVERKETEEQLIRMSSIVYSSPQYIAAVNMDRIFEYVNSGAVEITGYSEEELIGQPMEMLFGPKAIQHIHDEIHQQIIEQGSCTYELPMIRKNGDVRIMRFSAFTIGPEKQGVAAIALDMTEQRQLEEDLVSAKEQAERSNRAKSDFLSRMSHEMRTPMNAIIGMTSIAKTSGDTEKKDYCLDKIGDASNHLLGVINDILDMSKIEANKFELSEGEFNLEKMLIRVTNVMTFRIDEKKQRFTVRLGSDLPHSIIADEQRLAQVITNLLSNAVKFTPEGGHITLSVQNTDDSGGVCRLEITVKDSGIGIPAEQQPKLFQAFEQGDGGIARKYGGTGLGLAISKSIVELMGGEIHLESTYGEGSTFSFFVPVEKGDSHQHGLAVPDLNWANLRVLAVDDAPEVLEYFTSLAEAVGFQCSVAQSGQDALDLLASEQARPFNVIFVDWSMPEMDGISLMRQIKERYGSECLVIMISATEWTLIEREAKKAGADRFLQKPLFSSLIIDCLNECLGYQPQALETIEEQDYTGAFTGKRILLAEDMEINREIAVALLADTGATFDMAENGRCAVEKFAAAPQDYDAILMDIHMPELDGLEATRRIRSLDYPQAKTVPIIAMTANVFREDVENCLAAGMDDHVGKPIDLEEIFVKLANYIG